MSRYRTQLLAVGLGLTAAACSDPDLNTDLRPAGPPDVLAVLTQNPLDLNEVAVKCKYVDGERDPKAPAFVGDPITGGQVVCPPIESDFTAAELEPRPLLTLNAAGAVIDNQPWALRVMFDELLDADRVETLDCDADSGLCAGTLADTSPFKLTCGTMNTNVAYTGYYVPNGNNTTFPLGPSLYVKPDPDALTFPTGSTCTLTMDPNVVTDKDDVAVPEGDRSVSVKLADLALIAVDPAEGDNAVISPDPVAAGAAAFVFNASLDEDEVDPAQFEIKDSMGTVVPSQIVVDAYNGAGLTDAVYVLPDTPTGIFLPGDYTVTMKPGELTEVNGGTLTVAAPEVTHFAVAFAKTGQTSGTDLATNAFIRVSFNNTIDPTTVTADKFELFSTTSTPANRAIPFTVSTGNSAAALANIDGNAIIITPTMELPLGSYALRIKAGTVIKDIAATPHVATFTAPLALTFNVLLKTTHTIPANAPAGMPPNGLLTTGNFKAVFSGTLDPATVTTDDFEFIDTSANNVAVPYAIEFETSVARAAPAPGPHPNDTAVFNPTANLIVGHVYKVTLKAGAKLSSVANGGDAAVTRTFATAVTWTFVAI